MKSFVYILNYCTGGYPDDCENISRKVFYDKEKAYNKRDIFNKVINRKWPEEYYYNPPHYFVTEVKIF